MKNIRIIIERSSDGFFWAYSENVDDINGGGATATDCKKDVLDCIDTLKSLKGDNRPKWLDKEYRLIWKFDTESFLDYYKSIFSAPALSRMTGINEKQIHHYASGLKKPRPKTIKKFENALHQLGEELLTVEL